MTWQQASFDFGPAHELIDIDFIDGCELEWARACRRSRIKYKTYDLSNDVKKSAYGMLRRYAESKDLDIDIALRFIRYWESDSYKGAVVDPWTVGDMVQNEDMDARLDHALVQSPRFVADFIAECTIEPALEEFGFFRQERYGDLNQRIRILDPSSGTGHLLLSAADFMLQKYMAKGVPRWRAAANAVMHLKGMEINDGNNRVAKTRLVIWLLEMFAGDAGCFEIEGVSFCGEEERRRSLLKAIGHIDDELQTCDSLMVRAPCADVIVGNPPYVVPSTQEARDRYRKHYVSAINRFGMHACFIEAQIDWLYPKGYSGMIVSNNFQKRQFGVPLIEKVLPMIDMRCVIDTSGAYIPGHGTPTCILFFRGSGCGEQGDVLTFMSKRGEPGRPKDPAKGVVWTSISQHKDSVKSVLFG